VSNSPSMGHSGGVERLSLFHVLGSLSSTASQKSIIPHPSHICQEEKRKIFQNLSILKLGFTNQSIFDILYSEREENNMNRNFMKRETSANYTAWELKCRWVAPHYKRCLEKAFKRSNRRKVKQTLDKMRDF